MDSNEIRSVNHSNALVLGLIGMIAVHVMDLPGKLEEVPYLGVMYIIVILLAGFLVHRMISGATKRDYIAAAALAAAVIVGFVINRTVGMPGATDDIGNWSEPLGLLSLVIESWVVYIALSATRATNLASDASTALRAKVSVTSS
ncbi:MAG: hypothetical protein NTU77_00600 [Actinobacteria bacterium]|nr:hypothetical protein [Actinomycetota bacterium]